MANGINIDFSTLPSKVNTTQLGQFGNNDARKAIDRNPSYDIDHCDCCSVSQSGNRRTWWQIDLGKQYLIDSVSLFGRSDGRDQNQIQGAEVFAGNDTLSNDNLSGLKIFEVTQNPMVFNLQSSIIARYIIVRLNNDILTLCEFHLSTKECPVGSYGNGCVHACQCRCDNVCDTVTGHCKAGQCDPHNNLDECYTYDNVVQRLNASVEQSNTWTPCVANRAIDGNDAPIDTSNNALCQACSVAQRDTSTQNPNAWLILDLGKLVLIEHIRIIGRPDSNMGQSQNLILTISKMSLTSTSSGERISFNSASGYIFNIELSPPRIFQYLKIEKPELMTLCEVKLLEADDNLILRLKQASASQSKPWNSCVATNAYNGKIIPVDNTENALCSACSVAQSEQPGVKAWWRLDLGELALVKTITIFGRPDNEGQTQNLTMTISISDISPGNIGEIIPFNSSSGHTFKIDLPQPRLFRYLDIEKIAPLTLCEVKLFEGACNTTGKYGDRCFESCYCADMMPCEQIYGYCLHPGCFPGWKGQSCNSTCEHGSFGDGCQYTCHCINRTSCNNVNGTCTEGQCDPGWLGHNCSIPCKHGSFGDYCKFTCHCIDKTSCDNVNGTCTLGQCDPGWMGYNCSIPCEHGSFGDGCKFTCHCIDKTACDHVDGTCTVGHCDPGWLGHNCSIPCDEGMFGADCMLQCHCFHNTSCDNENGTCKDGRCDPGWIDYNCNKACELGSFGDGCQSVCHCNTKNLCYNVDGTCADGLCAPGWSGNNCSIQILKITEDDSPNTSAIAGGASAVVIVVASLVLVGFFMYRRHKSKSTNQDSANKFSHLDEALRQKQQRREETSQSSRHAAENVNAAYLETNAEDKTNTERDTGAKDNGGDYYEFGGVVGIKIHELWDYIHEKTKNDCEQLYEEFKTLPSGLIHPCASADHIANRGKNRYREMYAYDHNRVVLEEKNDKGTDYVNANYIDGYKETRRFVACQGPTKQMIEDFWRMVWQLKSDKIVMLTNLIEMGATKCVLYWPKEEEFTYGKINVKIVKLETDLDFDIRHLDVWKEGESPRRIRQYHFKSWPDKDVPDSTWCLVKFWRAVQTDAESKAGPIVVHCSAGVGRTGTFIALDNLIHQARDEGCVRPFQIVQALRGQRVNMVQTKEQYVYLHEVLADALSFGTHFVWSTQFEAVYMSLLQREDGEAKTRLEVQYDLILKSLKNTESKEAAEAPEYSNMEIILSESEFKSEIRIRPECDAYRPKLKKRGSTFVQQLGSTFIPNYDGRNTFLVAMSPDKSTIEEFWSLVDDLNIKTVIMLTEKSSTCYKTSCDLGAQNENGSKFHVNKLEEKIKKSYTERSFSFKELNREENDHLVTVKQFEYTAWKDGYFVPGDAPSLMDFLDEILKWQPHISESQPVLIYDSDGFSRSGILCVTLNEMQRINKDGGHINIVQSVKTMKQRKLQIIHNFEQYKFCYELILAHLKHKEVYQNLK